MSTFGPLLEDKPVWSGDGRRIIFTIGGDVGTLFEQGIDTAVPPRLLLETKQHKIPTSASRDGKFLLYTVENIGQSRADVWVLPLAPPDKPFPLIQRNFDQEQAHFSPDGRWIAYVSNESGRPEVLLQRFVPNSDDPSRDAQTVPVSAGGGTAPRWRADGRELYSLGPDDSVMAVDVHERATLAVGTPHVLFRLAGSHGDWDVLPDGSRFIIAIPPGHSAVRLLSPLLWNRLRQPAAIPKRR